MAVSIAALFLAWPGPWRSPFSGIPFSSRAHLVFVSLLVAALFITLLPPHRAVRARWLIALALLCGAKVLASSFIVPEGWEGRYWSAAILQEPGPSPLSAVRFYQRGVHPFRIDHTLDFNSATFSLFFVNDRPRPSGVRGPTPRQVVQPLLVRWTGYVEAPAPMTLKTALSANGATWIKVDGRDVFTGRSPSEVPVTWSAAAGTHRIEIGYDKRIGEVPAFSLAPLALPVTPVPTQATALTRSHFASRAIELLGLLAMVIFAVALADAYRPMMTFLLDEIWKAPDRIALVVLVSLILLLGVRAAIDTRSTTVSMSFGDDPLEYEGGARAILFHGLLMQTSPADRAPYFHYPAYSYVLAAAHAVFGEDYGTIRMVNWICLAAAAVLFWALLRRRLTSRSLVFLCVLFGIFLLAYPARYAQTAFTDNLFLPMTLAVVLACTAAFERGSAGLLFLCGVLAALGAATRPSLALFPPFLVAAVFFFWRGSVRRRTAAGAFSAGFAAGLAPFTLRNWIVAHKFVVLISSYGMLPLFLYPPGELKPAQLQFLIEHSRTFGGALHAAVDVFTHAPARTLWLEVRKALFTVGVTPLGSPGVEEPLLLIVIPIAFALAVGARRVPRALLIAITTFVLSHLAAMIVAAPWTYGYKSILPFHIVLLAGASLLLPRRGDALARDVVAPRPHMPDRKRVSVVLPTFNERDSIRQVILDFFATGVVDEVLVVNNNAVEGTSEQVAGTGAREIHERRQGYGAASRRGLREATGDYVVICEPDGTFLARDVLKLLAYADDFDVVYGSRTSQLLVWRGANMGVFLRLGNWAVAKYVQFLFNAPSLSDVGCTMRLLRRGVVERLAGEFEVDGSEFGPEMMVLTLRHHYRVVQIPVNYSERVGLSSVTGDPEKAFWLGLRMIWLITRHRLRAILEHDEVGSAEPQVATEAVECDGSEQTATMNS
jgi:hypothetical protein